MVDTVSKPATATNDDWEVAVDTSESDKRLEQQDKLRATNQEPAVSSTTNDDESVPSSTINLINPNKPIRILKRPTSQSQLLMNNDASNSSIGTSSNSTAMVNNNSSTSTSNVSTNASSTPQAPIISIIPRNPTKDATNSQNVPTFVNHSVQSASVKPPIKTYEQREAEYRLARLRIMGEEESSAKDDDDENLNNNTNTPTAEPPSLPTDDSTKSTNSLSTPSTISSNRTNNKISGLSHQQQQQQQQQQQATPLHCHPAANSYPSNLYALNNGPPNTGTIHFTPHNGSSPNIGPGPYSAPNFPQHFRQPYSGPYSHMAPPSVPPYPLPATTTTTLYMTSTARFVSAPSSSPSATSSYHYSAHQHPQMQPSKWYPYPTSQQTPYGAQQYGHPQ